MALFPGDMNIGWGFGLEPQPGQKTYDFRDEPECDLDGYNPDESQGELDDDSLLYITPLGEAYMASCEAKESQPTDPLLAVSELEERVIKSEEYARKLNEVCLRHRIEIEALKVHKEDMGQRITDLEERLRSLVFVVNSLVERNKDLECIVKDFLIAGIGNEEWQQGILTFVQKRIEKE